MRLIKYTHACVRLERDGDALVIDPGTWSEEAPLDDADNVLVTHEHSDHVDVERLARAAGANERLHVYAPAGVADSLKAAGVNATPVAAGEAFTVGTFRVESVGGMHAEIYDGLPGCENVGYVVEGVYHPGDSFFVPTQRVKTLLVPLSGPWFNLKAAIDLTKALGPARAFPIHDAMLNETGTQIMDRWMNLKSETQYARLAAGEAIEF